MAIRQIPWRVSLHWAASMAIEKAYHTQIMRDGRALHHTPYTTRLPRHTYGRNTGTAAIGCQGMTGANFENWGKYPLTPVQIERMCAEAAVIVDAYGIPIDRDHVFTHAEAAIEDGYGPYNKSRIGDIRWDLMTLVPTRGLNTFEKCRDAAFETGNILRRKITWYAQKRKEARK